MVVTDERLQVRRLLIFFQNFPKDVFQKKTSFPWGGNGDAKVVFFLAGSFSRNREVFESDGLIRRFFFFLICRCWWGNQMFSKLVPILEVIRRTKLMSIFRCVKVAPKSSLFFKVAMSILVEFSYDETKLKSSIVGCWNLPRCLEGEVNPEWSPCCDQTRIF